MPRPLGNLVHAEHPNEMIHFDYLFSSEGKRYSYLLIMKGDFTGFVLFHLARTPDADSTAQGLAKWVSIFGVPKVWHSDTASHFKNEVLKSLARKLGIQHTFAVAYAPWSNGSVERLCRSTMDVGVRGIPRKCYGNQAEFFLHCHSLIG